MSNFLTLSDFSGDDQETAAKKLALMFRMAPKQAYAILENISKGGRSGKLLSQFLTSKPPLRKTI